MSKKQFMIMILLCGIAAIVLNSSARQEATNLNKNLEDELTGGNTDEVESDTELSDMETGDNYSYLDAANNDNDQKELLQLEKQKQELELENQKMQLKQLEQEQQVPVDKETVKDDSKKDTSVKGLGLCNEQYNVNEENNDSLNLLNTHDCNSDYYTLNDDYLKATNEKIKPNELLPNESIDMKGENFLTATLSQNTEQVVGKPTQTNRSRLNYDLRSTPPNPQIEVSPWNMSTIEPDSDRRHFEIGTSINEPQS